MDDVSLDAIISDFTPTMDRVTADKAKTTITLWVTEEYKTKYDFLQQKSGRQFCKKLRELMLAAIDKAAVKVS